MWTLKMWALLGIAFLLVGATACSNASSSPTSAGPKQSSSSATTSGGVDVQLNQWSVTPSTTTPSAGPVTFNVTDAGTIPHEFVVLRTKTEAADISIEKFEGEPDRINEDTAGTNVGETGDLQPGASKSVTIDLKPGHYVFLCNLPAHYQSGMHVDVTVA
jgi:uncharacterized cupredoxin-like copper-binding protein